MDTPKRRELFARLQAALPNPTTELRHNSPFELLIAVILSAHATDASVNRATEQLFHIAPTPEMMLALGEEGIKDYIKNVGLYRNKAKYLLKTCEILINRHAGQVPAEREALEALPGVGRKTAGVILNTTFGHSTIAVDTHVFRVANRTGLAPGKTPRQVEVELERQVPDEYQRHAHHWLVLHGRYVCAARKPKCYRCTIADLCEYPHKVEIPA